MRRARPAAGYDQRQITVFNIYILTEAGELVQRNTVEMSLPGFRFPAPSAPQADTGIIEDSGQLRILLQRDQGAAFRKGKGSGENLSRGIVKKLVVSGAMIGLNWILLFEAYNHTDNECAA